MNTGRWYIILNDRQTIERFKTRREKRRRMQELRAHGYSLRICPMNERGHYTEAHAYVPDNH